MSTVAPWSFSTRPARDPVLSLVLRDLGALLCDILAPDPDFHVVGGVVKLDQRRTLSPTTLRFGERPGSRRAAFSMRPAIV